MKETEYHKINTIFRRDLESNFKRLLLGEFSLPEFEYLQNNNWIFTEKVDGTNIRIEFNSNITKDSTLHTNIYGKTEDSQIPKLLLDTIIDLYRLRLPKFFDVFVPDSSVTLYFEGYGSKIQKGGGKYRTDQSIVLFDINIDGWWLHRKNVDDVAKDLEFDTVPIVGKGTLNDMIKLVEGGFKSNWGDFIAEGIVARPEIELKTRSGDRIITKLKYKDFH